MNQTATSPLGVMDIPKWRSSVRLQLPSARTAATNPIIHRILILVRDTQFLYLQAHLDRFESSDSASQPETEFLLTNRGRARAVSSSTMSKLRSRAPHARQSRREIPWRRLGTAVVASAVATTGLAFAARTFLGDGRPPERLATSVSPQISPLVPVTGRVVETVSLRGRTPSRTARAASGSPPSDPDPLIGCSGSIQTPERSSGHHRSGGDLLGGRRRR